MNFPINHSPELQSTQVDTQREGRRDMDPHLSVERDLTIFKKRRAKGQVRWFVRVTTNFLEPRVYGPFPAEQDAERFREGAEFELRKLLDYELPTRSSDFRLSPPSTG